MEPTIPTVDVFIPQRRFIMTASAMISLTSSFVLARGYVHYTKRRTMEVHDYLIYAAYIFFVVMTTCYLIMIPGLYKVSDLTNGLVEPWEGMQGEIITYMHMMLVTTSLFWISLWTVKLSLLALYRRLMIGLPVMYMRAWWAVLVFCIISLVGCLVSYVTSCPDFAVSMTKGECPINDRSRRGQFASLYTAYAVDVVSDFMIMILPIKLVWRLQMPRGQKVAVIALFASGLVCIAFATLRVVQITKQANANTINATWLALWSMVETSIAVCIGCCPTFAILWRAAHTPRVSYDTQGFVRHNQDPSQEHPYHPQAIKMDTMAAGPARSRDSRRQCYWSDNTSSQEELAADMKGIRVTHTVEHDNSPPHAV